MNCYKCGEMVAWANLHKVGLSKIHPLTGREKKRYERAYPTYADEPKRELCEECLGWND
jgi:aromatic ring-cleaving dioxygenase